MKILDDIWSSVRGHTKARVKDPIVGAFIVSWFFCNWDKLAVLFWGSKKPEQRISDLSESMSVINDPSLLLTDLDLVIIPTVLTFIYLFVLPVFSLWVKKKQDNTILLQHSHAIGLDITRFEEQKSLNKAALRADPEKEFLAEEVKLDLQREKEKLERRNKVKEYLAKKAEIAKYDAEQKGARAEEERLELERKKRRDEVEKRRFDEQTAIHQATMASSRFPVIYQMMDMLSTSLHHDDITLSFDGLANAIASLFGYVGAKEMVDDDNFNTETLTQIKYLYHDPLFLTKKLKQIVINEQSANENLSEGILFDHLSGILENYPIEFLSGESIAERIVDSVNEHAYQVLGSDELSGPMAETDTVFYEIELEVEDFDFDRDFEVTMSGYATGNHRKDPDMPSQDLSVHVTATCEPAIGKYGLSSYELEISGSPRDCGPY